MPIHEMTWWNIFYASSIPGVPLLLDLYEGCQKSIDLGFVSIGDKIVKEIDVMNYSKVTIEAQFMFKEIMAETEPDDAVAEQASACLSPTTTTAQYIETGPSRQDNKLFQICF